MKNKKTIKSDKNNKTLTSKNNIADPSIKSTNQPFSIRLLKNIMIFFGALFLVYCLKNFNNGYKWTFETLIKQNLITIKKYKKLKIEQKYEAKVGFNYQFLNFINKNTPQDAIIIMPPDSVFLPVNKKSDFQKFITYKGWPNYFVYPRRLVYEKDKDINPLYIKATHVAIVNYWGYHKLPYNVKTRNKYSVLPLKVK